MISDFRKDFHLIQEELRAEVPDYAAAKERAGNLDAKLGFSCARIEDALFEKTSSRSAEKQNWIGLDLQSLQTPYSELVAMARHLRPGPGETWLDLGAAYGRMGIVLGFLYPLVHFVGYEMLPERVAEGNRVFRHWKLGLCRLEEADLGNAAFRLRPADLYFLYDFGSKKDVYRIIRELAGIARERPIRVIARGRGVRNWIMMDFPWLSQIQPPEVFENWTLFRS